LKNRKAGESVKFETQEFRSIVRLAFKEVLNGTEN